jgi:hypothetical protein
MTFDVYRGEIPTVGLVLIGERARHVVVGLRPIDSKLWHDRWSLEVRKMAPDEPIPEGAPVWDTQTYPSGYCPACIAKEAGQEIPAFVVHRCAAGG